jgi:hypothetical protein
MEVIFSFSQDFYDEWLRKSAIGKVWNTIANSTKPSDMFTGTLEDGDITITDERLIERWINGDRGKVSYSHYILMEPRDIVRNKLNGYAK